MSLLEINKISGLYALVDSSQAGLKPLDEIARDILVGGAKIIQLRMKNAAPADVFEMGQKMIALKADHDFVFILNDHPDLALKLGADGVHLGQSDTSVSQARDLLGPDIFIGKSTHSLVELDHALSEDIDYLALGAIFPTTGKAPGHPVVGVDMLRQVVDLSPVPVVAIGGIDRSNIQSVIDTGVACVAMISGLTKTGDIVAETKFYVNCFNLAAAL